MIVIKLGGRVQSGGDLIAALGEKWRGDPGCMCVVHGGGDEISSLQQQMGRAPLFVDGRRITSDEDIELVRMVLSGSANKRLVASLVAAGLPAVGVSGEDAGMLEAAPIDIVAFGRAGKPVSVNTRLIDSLASAGFLPVISPVARDIESDVGAALNVNGDDAAAAIASALRAELWLIADVSGVLDDRGSVIPALNRSGLIALLASGVVNRGMHAKLDAGFTALENGAAAVRIAGLGALGNGAAGQGTHLKLGAS